MTCEEGPETVFSMFYPTYLLSFIIFTSKYKALPEPEPEPMINILRVVQEVYTIPDR
jgi:hypothetical protein